MLVVELLSPAPGGTEAAIMAPDADKQKQTVFLVDDHPLVREWLANLINQQPDLHVCGEAGNRAQALGQITALQPRVAIVDISLDRGSGLELIKDLKAARSSTLVVVLSMHDELLYAERAMRAGARGYVMKREATRSVLQAIRCVLSGKPYLSESIARLMAEKLVEGAPAGSLVEQLSDRELEVFELLGRGFGSRRIADTLNVSFKTVQAFRARIKEKLNLPNATMLLREATRWYDSKHSQ
jgi:DNA-binding NarL/FixJ family response regulator